MMGTKEKPSAFDCYAKAEPDEPMFILLGRDKHAPALVRLWAEMRDLDGEDPEIVQEADECAGNMEMWRIRNRPNVPAVRCASCDNGVDPEWTYCPFCGAQERTSKT